TTARKWHSPWRAGSVSDRSKDTPVADAPGSPLAECRKGHPETTMRQIQIGDSKETVIERGDYPPDKIRAILGNETVAVLGYGVQGRSQSLNMKDNGLRVVVGQREKTRSWDLAVQDGWVPGQTLFP